MNLNDDIELTAAWQKMTRQERAEVKAILMSRVIPDVLQDTFDLQRQFIQDTNKLKVLFCTRRSAKSYTCGTYLIKTALERPKTSSVYIGLTRDQSKRLVWNDILKEIVRKYGIVCRFNETELTITFENGSVIYVVGVDDSEAERDKLLGKKYALAVIDEAASFKTNLKELIYKVLMPAMSDLGGTIVMCGTPDNNKTSLFFELSKNTTVSPPARSYRDGWRIYSWSTFDNPYMSDQWAETIRELKKSDPFVEEQAWFKQHYLGQWVIEDNNKIYKYKPERNDWDGVLKDYGWKQWQYALGIDLGFDDATALVLMAYHENDPNVYIMQAAKWRGLTISDTADKIREWMANYPINHFVVDGANKQAVEEMVRHQQLPLQAAEKHDKISFIRIMNSDFISGKIKIDPSKCQALIEEYDKAIWNRIGLEKGVYKEDSSYHPDAADAALYAYRFCYHYASTKPTPDQFFKTDLEKEMHELNQIFNRQRQDREDSVWGSEHIFDGDY